MFLLAPHKINILYDLETIKVIRDGDETSFKLTPNLMVFLTKKGVIDTQDENAKRDYQHLVKQCLGPELHLLKISTRSAAREKLYTAFRDSKKFVHVIQAIDGLGLTPGKEYSYRHLARNILIIPEDKLEQQIRFFKLLCSANSGTYNKEMTREFSELLDRLYKSNSITKPLYKVLYHAFKNACDRNQPSVS